MRHDWMKVIKERSVEGWVGSISACTKLPFKILLARPVPPSIEEIIGLEYYDTELPGVYISYIKQKDGKGKDYLYVGSASSDRGIKHRVRQHCNSNYSQAQACALVSMVCIFRG